LVRSAEKRQRRVLTEKTFRCRTLAQDAVITLKLHNGHVTLSNVEVRLRPKEMEVFEALLDHSGQVVSKADLARVVWGSRAPLRTSIVETWICRLRTALGPAASVIETAPGGYRIAQD
jgi:DNA-binding response OmpR family regulator